LQLGTSTNGYPTITLDSPLEPFAEFLRAAHSPQSARHILLTVDAVLAGDPRTTSIGQDYAELTLEHSSVTASVRIDNLSTGIEETAEMSLHDFRNTADAWAAFLDKNDHHSSQ
jgi:hypothetical protein